MSISTLLRRSTRRLSLRGEMTLPSGKLIPLTGDDILSFTLSEGVGDGVLLGSCPSASLRLTLADPGGDFLFLGEKRGAASVPGSSIRLFLQVMDDDGRVLESPLGLFYVTDLKSTENAVACTVQAVDALGAFFDAPFTDVLTYPCTLLQVAQHIAMQAGVTVNEDFPCANLTVDTAPDFSSFTLRRALSALCAVCASFAYVDRTGQLCITPICDPRSDVPYPLDAPNALSRAYHDASFGPLSALRVTAFNAPRKADDQQFLITDDVGVRPDAVYDLSGNPFLGYGAPHTYRLAQAAFYQMKGYTLQSASLRWQGDPELQLGRRVCMTDKRGQVTLTHVTRQTLTFDRGFSMVTECALRSSSGASALISPSGSIRGSAITGSIHGNLIIDGSLGVTALAARSITADYIAASAIDTVHLAASSVTADQLSAGAVTAEKIKSGAITANEIKTGTITADKMQTGTITAQSGIIADSAIGTTQIADGSITDAKIVSLTAGKITAGTLDAANVNVINLKADNLTTGTINGQRIPTLGSDKIADGAISGVKILDGAVTTDKITDGAVTAAKVVASAITADKLAANAVTANKILSGAVTTDKLSANAVTAAKIKANTITANKLASDVGSSLDLSSNMAITSLVRDVGAKPVVYTQYAAPAEPKQGDVWLSTGSVRWQDADNASWGDRLSSCWGDLYNCRYQALVYHGKGWTVASDRGVTIDQETRIRQTEQHISLMATKTELDGKVSKTEYRQEADAISLRVQSVEAMRGKAETVTNTAVTLDASGIHMNTGGVFTVDSGNFSVDENGAVSMLHASVNGELLNQGHPVLTAKDLIVSTTRPTDPIVGTVWVKPLGATVAAFAYNNASVTGFDTMESTHVLTNKGSAVSAAGNYTYHVSIPYKVTSSVTAIRYLRMTLNGQTLFDAPLATAAGAYTLVMSGDMTSWLGNAATLPFTLELHFLEGNESYLHNVHRLNTGAVELRLTAASDAATGWLGTEIQVFNG